LNNLDWYYPATRSKTLRYGFAVKKRLVAEHSKYQKIEIVETYDYGKMIILDEIPQACEMDEFILHEAMAHPTLCIHPNPRDVLIIGGGGGGTLREVLKHKTVQRVVMVEIDELAVHLWRDYLPSWDGGAFDDPRAEIHFEDGFNYIATTQEKFDVILLDLSDPFDGSPSQKLFTQFFYQDIKKVLKDENGLVFLQAESAVYGNHHDHLQIIADLGEVFKRVEPYYAFIPMFESLYGFVIAGETLPEREIIKATPIDEKIAQNYQSSLRFFDEETFVNAFSVPRYLREEAAQNHPRNRLLNAYSKK
jgi:spermidine synthase